MALIKEMIHRNVLRSAAMYIAVAWGGTEILTYLIEALWGGTAATAASRYLAILFITGFPVMMYLAWTRDLGLRGRRIIGASTLAIVVMATLAWLVPPESGAPSRASARGSGPSSYDLYLNGLELLERWDVGDNLDAAIRSLREATALDPSFALAFAKLADALRTRYRLTSETESLEEASASALEAIRLNPGLAPVQIAHGRIQADMGNIDMALESLQRAILIDPNNANGHQAIATLFERLGRIEDAEASFQRALSLDPKNVRFLDSYGNFLFRQSRFEQAASQWRKVVRITPDNFVALTNLAAALSELGKNAESITLYQRALEIRPSYMAYSNLGTAYSWAKRYPDAVDAYRKALEINDSDWLAWGNLAYVYSWMEGMQSRAIETFRKAIQVAEDVREESSRDPFIYSDLALYYAKIGQSELALQRLGTALALSPDSSQIQTAAAETYELLGQRNEAVERLRRSLILGYPHGRLFRNPEMTDLLADPRIKELL